MEGMENTLCNKLYSPMQNDRTFCRNLSTLTQTTSGGSRPSDKEEGLVIQTLSWGGGAVSKKRFLALWASVWSKNKVGAGPPLERPLKISPFNRLKRLFVVQQYFGQLNIYFKHEVWALDHKVFYFLLLNRRISFPL